MTVLKSAQFRREREATWRKLDRLLVRIEDGGMDSLSEADLEELPRLHRATVSALSVARAVSLDRSLLEYLEALTARSFFCVYSPRRRFWPELVKFFRVTFPAAVRGNLLHLALAWIFLGAGMLTAYSLVMHDESLYESFISAAMAQGRDFSASDEELRSILYSGGEQDADDSTLTVFAAFLFQHNAQIGLLAFALGFALGVPVFYLLFTNGLILGAMVALYDSRGMGAEFWSWILPHGITEIGAIALCGAAGLSQAEAILFPGRHTRLANLARVGRRAGVIAVGSVALFAIAALLEGYFRQWVDSLLVRYVTAAITLVGWVAYFGWCGRGEGRS